MLRNLWRRLKFFLHRARFEQELHDEMRLHAELRAKKLQQSGVSQEEAAFAARRRFGNRTLYAEDSGAEWTFTWFESFLQDVRYALRTFRRAPMFSCGVAVTIGVGLGLICSLFTIFNAYVLRPFAVRDPHSLAEFSWVTKAGQRGRFGSADLDRLRLDKTVFSEVLGTADASILLDGRAFPGRLVTGNYFSMLGVHTALGRTLLPEDAAVPGAQPVVVLSYQAWQNSFGGAPDIVGKKIPLLGYSYEVVGVAQPEFVGLEASSLKQPSPDFWVPITMAQRFSRSQRSQSSLGGRVHVIGRLKPEITRQQAKAALEIDARRATADLPEADRPIRFLLESRATAIPLTPSLLAAFSAVLTVLGLVLLIACANVANMLLARAMARRREIGTRLSLGAARSRLVRQLLTEAILLSLPGAAIGFAIAWGAARFGPSLMLSKLLPPELASILRIPSLEPDLRVFLFVLVAALLAAMLFGLAPAIQGTRASLNSVARGDLGSDPGRLRNVLAIAQVSLCVLFLVSAGVLLRGSRELAERDTGMQLGKVANVELTDQSRTKISERLRDEPWVDNVAFAWRAPLYGMLRTVSVLPSGAKQEVRAGYNFVSPDYFGVLGIPLKRGRNFTRQESDGEAAVVIVSDATARRFWPDQDPIGKSIAVGKKDGDERAPNRGTAQVIGIAGDAISGWIADGVDPTCLYFPFGSGSGTLLVRVRGGVPAARKHFAAAVEKVEPHAEWQFVPMEEVASAALFPFRAASLVAWLLGGIALALTLSGIYGVLSYLVSQRMKEIGIRMALGASTAVITRGILGQSLRLAAIGAVLGVLPALVLSRLMAANMEMMNTFDGLAYLGGVTTVVLAALAAAYIPSRRATRVDPATTLRAE